MKKTQGQESAPAAIDPWAEYALGRRLTAQALAAQRWIAF